MESAEFTPSLRRQPRNTFETRGNVSNQAGEQNIYGDVIFQHPEDNSSLVKLLPYAAQAAFNSADNQHDPLCLQDTRVDVLNQIKAWADGGDERCIFWLNGMAGTGKSTIARTIAQEYYNRKRLGASFFFSRGVEDRSHAGKLFTTIAVQLAQISALKEHISTAINEHNDIAGRSQRDQWKYLILQPLSKLTATNSCQSPLVFVIDALDECNGDKDVRGILQLFAEAKSLEPIPLRIFVTSRPETPIRLGFRNMPGILHQDLVLQHISPTIVNKDIFIFFEHKLEEIRNASDHLPVGWPGKDIISILVSKAHGLFIYAATVCRFIEQGGEQWPPDDLLCLILQGNAHNVIITEESPTKDLDKMYSQILQLSFKGINNPKDKQQLTSIFRQVIGAIVILFNPLSVISISRLLDVEGTKIQMRLRHLHSVLEIPENQIHTIKLLHPSFRDFLLDKERCADQRLWVDEKKAHAALADACIRLMSNKLRRDICDLRLPGVFARETQSDRIVQHIPAELQYACRYWVRHLQKSETQLFDNGQVHIFFQDHFLHWLEVLSLIEKTSEGVFAIRSLESFVQTSISPTLYAFIHDAKRFVLFHRWIIEYAPLQIYLSALVFAPENSIVRRKFKREMPSWMKKPPKMQPDWGAGLQTLEGHSDWVNSVAFSPDGKLVASGSDDKTVRLWDAGTGAAVLTLEGHSDDVASIAFSPDSRLVASGSWDATIRLWNTNTGAVLWNTNMGASLQTLKSYLYSVNPVAFSPDSKLIVSGSRDKIVRLWNASTGAAVLTLEGHSDAVTSVAFSPDGKLVASGSLDKTIRLWDTSMKAMLHTLEGHLNWVSSVAFSPDSKLVASSSCDETVRLWDAGTGAVLQILKGSSRSVNSVAFSPDSKLVVSGSDDETVRLWDAGTGEMLQILKGHSESVTSVAFSPDSKLAVSGSRDKTVRLWNIGTKAALQTAEGYSDFVNLVVLSPDGKLVTSGLWGIVRLWDAATGVALQTLEGHISSVNSIVFSPDGKLVVSGSDDNTVRLWDTDTGTALQILEGHSKSVYSVAFSPDGKLVVSGSSDETVRLWNTATGVALQTLRGHLDSVSSVAFSPDGKLVVSGSRDKMVRLWNANTGAAVQTLMDHSNPVKAIAFSPDSKLVVSGSEDTTVKLWEASTGAMLRTLKGHLYSINSVTFSPDGKLVASGSWDGTIRLWDARTGAALQTLRLGMLTEILSFSASGQYLTTNRGVLDIRTLKLLPDSSEQFPVLFVSNDWVTEDGENILWLPPDYRATRVAVWKGIVVLGHSPGRGISFLEFEQGLKTV